MLTGLFLLGSVRLIGILPGLYSYLHTHRTVLPHPACGSCVPRLSPPGIAYFACYPEWILCFPIAISSWLLLIKFFSIFLLKLPTFSKSTIGPIFTWSSSFNGDNQLFSSPGWIMISIFSSLYWSHRLELPNKAVLCGCFKGSEHYRAVLLIRLQAF